MRITLHWGENVPWNLLLNQKTLSIRVHLIQSRQPGSVYLCESVGVCVSSHFSEEKWTDMWLLVLKKWCGATEPQQVCPFQEMSAFIHWVICCCKTLPSFGPFLVHQATGDHTRAMLWVWVQLLTFFAWHLLSLIYCPLLNQAERL